MRLTFLNLIPIILSLLPLKAFSQSYSAEIIFPDHEKKTYALFAGKDFPNLKVEWSCSFEVDELEEKIKIMTVKCRKKGDAKSSLSASGNCAPMNGGKFFSIPLSLLLSTGKNLTGIKVQCE